MVEVRKIAGEGEVLREVMVKIGLERIYTQKRIMVEALLDSKATELVISSEFAKKQKFKLKKIKRPIYMRMSRLLTVDFIFIFSFHFILSFLFLFLFPFIFYF